MSRLVYLDIILSIPDAGIEIVPSNDHIAYPIRHRMKSPKLSLWEIYKIKKYLETGYEKLNEAQDKISSEDIGERLDSGSSDDNGSVGEDTSSVERDKEQGNDNDNK